MPISFLHTRILSGRSFHESLTCCLIWYEFIGATALLLYQNTFLEVFPLTLFLKILLIPHMQWSLSLGRPDCCIDSRLRLEHSEVSFRLCFVQLCGSALITTFCKMKLLWPSLRAAPIYVFSDKWIKVELKLCCLEKE